MQKFFGYPEKRDIYAKPMKFEEENERQKSKLDSRMKEIHNENQAMQDQILQEK